MGFSGFMQPALRKALRMRFSEKTQLRRVRALSLHATTGPQPRVLSYNMALLAALTPPKPCGRW